MIDVLMLLYFFLSAPKLLWDRLVKGKRHPGFWERMGVGLPPAKGPLIWIHAISVGEIKSAEPLFWALKEKYPDFYFLISTTTATGYAQAQKTLQQAGHILYAPVDFSWVVRRWVRTYKPQSFILVESDFWPNLLKELKSRGTCISLVSGKISERSYRRFKKVPFFTKRLFSYFDVLCVQNELYKQRFSELVPDPKKLVVTGNLKLDIRPSAGDVLNMPEKTVTLSCTHAPEEEMLLDIFIDSEYFLILAPRHPERFEEVAELLTRKCISFSRWKDRHIVRKVLLVDAMGQLAACYESSRLAISGGSFVKHVGGHNIVEPLLYGTPVFFGPYMHGQMELAKRVLDAGAGKQVRLEEVRQSVDSFFTYRKEEQEMLEASSRFVLEGRGSTRNTIGSIALMLSGC
ncbi:MAG: hypothetical protein A3C42_05635 [Chlamydiae bacterium RIFCSPHIGHO2_02_FULL_45_9]|nr:MAG: hypothetical protein A3C42_05635 [Chlamydiae bacterium RIFCSPHIGHO2_02_FULL_45_9]OGN66106.1 MAG: hypothetical protein A2978_04385 [Chlamydiae bacterium RIFCSPLOWO2_01_FULL_44_52]OGN68641.1 MAG: hypothetical protein A3I67_02710 [Chlamydiae bacterium RIFCSPLOWO2_02_FULL_45_22]